MLRRRSTSENQYALDKVPKISSIFSIYDYAENDQNTHEWIQSRQSIDLVNILPVPPSAQARIVVLQGLSEAAIASCRSQLGVPREFFTCHESESDHMRIIDNNLKKHCFSTKWSRLANQSARHWKIESLISRGTPYNVDTFKDPKDLRLDHERYQRFPSRSRPFSPISQLPNESMQHAARESISVFWVHDDPSLFALIVVDPIREYLVIEKKWKLWGAELADSLTTESCFLDECRSHATVRLVEELKKSGRPAPRERFIHQMKTMVGSIIVADATEVLTSLHEALDDIDLSLSNDDILRRSLHVWRTRFGLWRHDLQRSRVSVINMFQRSGKEDLCSSCALQPSSGPAPTLEMRSTRLKADIDETLARLTSTFQAVMSTISIVESQKAISEAETVSKLTALAFFFIPLSFVTSLFGMNVVEFDEKLRIWMWVAVSATVMVLSYALLYLGTITTTVRKTPQFFLNLNSRRVSVAASRWIRITLSSWPIVLVLLVYAGLGVGLWKLYTSGLSKWSKVGISLAIFGVPSLVFFYPSWTTYRMKRRLRRH